MKWVVLAVGPMTLPTQRSYGQTATPDNRSVGSASSAPMSAGVRLENTPSSASASGLPLRPSLIASKIMNHRSGRGPVLKGRAGRTVPAAGCAV